ncbi:MAG: SCP2 sterol-binding domain-containing protein [Myxococcales bacterium FL481]|nr:MAG: SCP2 sterol-binding domain-containing protein [Myxococcales bacterium FL481]
MTLEQHTQQLRERVGEDSGLGSTLKLDLSPDGVIHIDAVSVPNVVSNDDKEAACTIKLSVATLDELAAGDLAPTTAFMTGKLAIDGDMGIALKLQDIL